MLLATDDMFISLSEDDKTNVDDNKNKFCAKNLRIL